LITYRNRIKQTRELIQKNFRRDLEKRKKTSNYSFNLPHTESKEEILMLEHVTAHKRYKTEHF
jgi:hypothetical protein